DLDRGTLAVGVDRRDRRPRRLDIPARARADGVAVNAHAEALPGGVGPAVAAGRPGPGAWVRRRIARVQRGARRGCRPGAVRAPARRDARARSGAGLALRARAPLTDAGRRIP